MRPWSWDAADGRAHLKLYKPFGGEADHLAQKFGIRGLLHERAQVIMSLVIGGPADKWLASTIKPYWKPPVTAQRSATPRYGTQSFFEGADPQRLGYLTLPPTIIQKPLESGGC